MTVEMLAHNAQQVRVIGVQLIDVRSAQRVRQNASGAAARLRLRIQDDTLAK